MVPFTSPICACILSKNIFSRFNISRACSIIIAPSVVVINCFLVRINISTPNACSIAFKRCVTAGCDIYKISAAFLNVFVSSNVISN